MNMLSMIKRLAGIALTALVLTTASAPAQEVDPAHLDLARKYIELTDKSGIFEVTIVRTGVQVLKLLTSQNPDIADKLSKTVADSIEDYKGRKGELIDQFARVYVQKFSIEELKEIVAFYESPTGAKLANANAEVNQQIQSIMGVYQKNLNIEMLAKVRANLKEQGFDI